LTALLVLVTIAMSLAIAAKAKLVDVGYQDFSVLLICVSSVVVLLRYDLLLFDRLGCDRRSNSLGGV